MSNSDSDQSVPGTQNHKLASSALVRPHAALREFISLPDVAPSQPRGMALIDKIDESIAADELESAKKAFAMTDNPDMKTDLDSAQLQYALVKERIEERLSAIPHYDTCMIEVNKLMTAAKDAVQKHDLTDRENVPFYRLLREEILKKA